MELRPEQEYINTATFSVLTHAIISHHFGRQHIANELNRSGLSQIAWENVVRFISEEEMIYYSALGQIKIDLYEEKGMIGLRFCFDELGEDLEDSIDEPIIDSNARKCLNPKYEPYFETVDLLVSFMHAINHSMIWVNEQLRDGVLTETQLVELIELKKSCKNYFAPVSATDDGGMYN